MRFYSGNTGVVGLIVLGVIPAVIWFLMEPLSFRFGSFSLLMTSLGQLTSLVGMALFSINLILSGRFRFMEKYFNGLNRMYVVHHSVGGLAFILLLAHPMFLVARLIPASVKAAFSFLFGFSDWIVVLGELSLLLMIFLLVITFYARWKYENWRLSHQWLGLVFFIGGLHMFFIPSDISANLMLRVYMFGLSGFGLVVFFYKTVFKLDRWWKYNYIVENITRINENVISIDLMPENKKIKFLPGQFVFVRFENDGVPQESHPFSITASPTGNALSLGVKALGDFTSMLYFLKKGVRACVEGPFGTFSYLKFLGKKQIWVAGGIGITPFLSMARDLASGRGGDYDIDLFYSVRNRNDAVFLDELLDFAKRIQNFRVTPFYSEESGRITAEFMSEHSTDFSRREIFLCGPPEFMRSIRDQFKRLGVPTRNIHSEEFQLQN